ncbi:Ig-like domain-containing protein [Methanobrevibacter sp. DSM 116169]|uniref:Ig-like domain-containing protein n=1 Tax=Methanobrevibacter sp. DSM 116169 TaxID=3242727 RepID=UPI0038FC7E84
MVETIVHYPEVVTQIESKINPPYTRWDNLTNLLRDNGLSATSEVNSNSNSNKYPINIYTRDYKFNIPSDAKIIGVTVNFNLQKTGDIVYRTPKCKIRLGDYIGDEYELTYPELYYSNNPYLYSMFINSQFNPDILAKITPEILNSDAFGSVFYFEDEKFTGKGTIKFNWVNIIVYYETASATIGFANGLHSSELKAKNGPKLETYNYFGGTAHLKDLTRIDFGKLDIKVELPLGLSIDSGSGSHKSKWDNTHKIWTVEWDKLVSDFTMNFRFLAKTTGMKKIKFHNELTGTFYAYLYIQGGTYAWTGDDDVAVINTTDLRRNGEPSEEVNQITVSLKAEYDSSNVTYNAWLEQDDRAVTSIRKWKLNPAKTTNGIEIEWQNQTSVGLKNVPTKKEITIEFILDVKPRVQGNVRFTFDSEETGNQWYIDTEVGEPFKYVLLLRDAEKLEDGWKFKTDDPITFVDKLVPTRISTGAFSFPCRTHPLDKVMRVLRSTLKMHKYNERNYIGPIPLKQTHYSPEYSYMDTLLETSSKNIKYMGKKGAGDEKLSFNVRLHPHDVTVLKGLVDMDKPVPINANHLCFEGDVLNHRGWAELYGISKVTKTNPSWYDVDISVKYLTHNINARFKIVQGDRISNYFLPNLFTTKFFSGDKINEYFITSTTGSYVYDSYGEDTKRFNVFSLENGEFFKLSGLNYLAPKCNVSFSWDSTRVVENVDNEMNRIVRLIDARTNNPVLEYEYYDFDFSKSKKYPCRVMCRVLSKGAFKTVLNKNVNLHCDAEAGLSNEDIDTYGSTLNFKLIGNRLTIHDEGLSGKEVYMEDIQLESTEYYLETEFKNNNLYGDAPAIVNYVDFDIREIDYSSKYVNYYENLMVAPFPVPNKELLFTRESEEGTIFYQVGDGNESSYRLSPFYQYWTGVNLESRDGISLFNLDNSHEVVYITNGLVKIGINRYNGRCYLYKFDRDAKTYIEICRFQLTKYNDIGLNSFTDDKLELQVSDTIFTVWRGRPFVQINHPTEELLLSSKVTGVWAERVGEYTTDFSSFVELIDNTNKLPACISDSEFISDKCITVDVLEKTGDESDLVLSCNDELDLNQNSLISLSSTILKNVTVTMVVDNEVVGNVSLNSQGKGSFTYKFNKHGEHKITAVFIGDSRYLYCVGNVLTPTVLNNGYSIEIINGSELYYLEDDFMARLTLAGEPVSGEVVDFIINGVSYTKTTNSEGVAIVNNNLDVKEYNVYAEYTHAGGEVLVHDNKMTTIKKGITELSINTTIVNKGGYVLFKLVNNTRGAVNGANVQININGVVYNRVTDSNGEVRLNINLDPRNYDIRATFMGNHNLKECAGKYELVVRE